MLRPKGCAAERAVLPHLSPLVQLYLKQNARKIQEALRNESRVSSRHGKLLSIRGRKVSFSTMIGSHPLRSAFVWQRQRKRHGLDIWSQPIVAKNHIFRRSEWTKYFRSLKRSHLNCFETMYIFVGWTTVWLVRKSAVSSARTVHWRPKRK